MKKIRLPAALLLTALLLTYPTDAANAAREALYSWATTVAPSMLPFLLLLPLLTAPESLQGFERILKPLMRLLGLPGASAPAVALSMVAGTPTGAVAARNLADAGRIDAKTQERITCCCAGVSPMFLLGGLFKGGQILLRAQLLTQITLLIWTTRREINPHSETKAALPPPTAEPVWTAVRTALTVGGSMTAFSVLTALTGRFVRSLPAEAAAAIFLDLPTAARKIAALRWTDNAIIPIEAAAVGLCGACIGMQNLSAAGKSLRPLKYLCSRIAAAALMLAFSEAQIMLPMREILLARKKILPVSALIAVFFTLPMWIGLRNTSYLNKRKKPVGSKKRGK